MDKRSIVLGLIILIALVGAVILFRNSKKIQPLPTPVPTPSISEKIEKTFNYQIPSNVEKAELKDVSGGTGSALSTRKYEAGTFSLEVLGDLPEPAAGSFYEVWLMRGKEGDANFSLVLAGKLRIAKGGYLLDFNSNTDYSDYKEVIITLEKTDDRNPEVHILEGSF